MSGETMDPISSLKKVSRELLEINWDETPKEEIQEFIEGASWLINYIATALDTELQLAMERGNDRIMKELSNG